MFLKFLFLSFIFALSSFSYASAEFGLSSSGEDIGVGVWFGSNRASTSGGYLSLQFDSNDYENGDRVSVCNDGAISGSTGSGTCSGHGGVSTEKNATFSRWAIILGKTHNLTRKLRLNGGLSISMYGSNVNIGDVGALDYTRFGLDFGASYKIYSEIGLSINYETESERTLFGVWFPL